MGQPVSSTPIRSIGIIMDGNRRWAQAKGLTHGEGHRAGFAALRKLAKHGKRLQETYGIEYVTLYAFSQENWDRQPEEVSLLMDLLNEGLKELVGELRKNATNISARLRMIGDRSRLPETTRAQIEDVEAMTAGNTDGTLAIALSYGGRAEILDAVNRLIENAKGPVDEKALSASLWSAGIPDPDLIIRTSGEHRLSGFLTWQSAYSELFFSDTLWPDFTAEELEKILEAFKARPRRYGR